ncbi:MAG: hypothetical protein U1E80_07530 [Piscinibacter sp.]|nr:hypothetical protein [Pseudomonadota bacterium]
MKPVEPGALSIAPESVVQPPEQLRYARWLEWGTRVGLAALTLIFLAYGIGLVEPHVPHSRLPEVWNLPVSQFLAATGLPTGWGWLAFAHRGDIANLLGIAMLTGASLLALLALLPLYLRQRDRLYAALCVAQVAVLLLAASGLLTAGH